MERHTRMDQSDDAPGDGGEDDTTPVPPADPAWVRRLAAVRPEPEPDGQAPNAEDLERILATATTVADHGSLEPWRFAVCSGVGRDRFADALVAGLYEARGLDLPEAVVAKMRGKAYAAPCSVVLIASPDPICNVEVWEQVASASCTGYAVVLAATGLGYGAVWKSAGVLGTGPMRALFGLNEHESLLGWVNVGTAAPLGRKKSGDRPTGDPLLGRVLRIDA
jgi:nitroreductase